MGLYRDSGPVDKLPFSESGRSLSGIPRWAYSHFFGRGKLPGSSSRYANSLFGKASPILIEKLSAGKVEQIDVTGFNIERGPQLALDYGAILR